MKNNEFFFQKADVSKNSIQIQYRTIINNDFVILIAMFCLDSGKLKCGIPFHSVLLKCKKHKCFENCKSLYLKLINDISEKTKTEKHIYTHKHFK